jgi:uncharacterized damage-inducible protein DinB
MFTKDGIRDLHTWLHQTLDTLLQHVSTVPTERLRVSLPGFGVPTVWKQLVHILEVEETWVLDLQDRSWTHWREEDCADLGALLANKARVQSATQDYLDGLSDMQLNRRLTERPKQWVGELKSPAFIILHIVTHAFHHKGQVVAMLRTLGYPAPDTDLQRA